MQGVILIFLCLLSLALCPSMWLILEKVQCDAERKYVLFSGDACCICWVHLIQDLIYPQHFSIQGEVCDLDAAELCILCSNLLLSLCLFIGDLRSSILRVINEQCLVYGFLLFCCIGFSPSFDLLACNHLFFMSSWLQFVSSDLSCLSNAFR